MMNFVHICFYLRMFKIISSAHSTTFITSRRLFSSFGTAAFSPPCFLRPHLWKTLLFTLAIWIMIISRPDLDLDPYIGDLNHDNIKTWFGFRSFRILSHENKQQIIFQIMIWVCRVPIPMLLLCSASHLLATPLSCFVCYPLVLWFYIANKKIDHYIWYHHPTEIVVVSRWIMAL